MSTTTTTILASLTLQESAGAVKNKANFIASRTKDSPDADAHRMSASALSNLQDQIYSLNKNLRLLASVSSQAFGPKGTTVLLDETLVPGSTITITPGAPTSEGVNLEVFVLAKGPTALLAWGSTTKWAPTEFDSTTDTWTVFSFVSRSDPTDSVIKWFYKGPSAVTGETP